MRIKPIHLSNTNQLVQDYMNQENNMDRFFDYLPFEEDEKRLADLKKRSFQREKLANTLHKINRDWDPPKETSVQIDRLKDPNSVVVIGGQQAGLLTGPMYTVNKVISILKLAKEKEEKLNIPVIPVFWIAGEDHDYDEINHIFIEKGNKLHKHPSPQELYLKHSVSEVDLDREKVLQWIKQAFYSLKETENTKSLYEAISACLNKSRTYVDFFARLIYSLFPDQGIVLLDSAHSDLRHLEKEGFEQLIKNQSAISKAVYETVQRLQQNGYAISLEVEEDDAHLFFHDINNERILLKRSGEKWIGKNDEVELTTEELLTFAKEEPERLSNNVVTRPIMQELLFPTLTFIGGHGEISYWATLKEAFRAVDNDLFVPPTVPRLSLTYITDRVNKLLKMRVIDPEYIINHDLEILRNNWLMSQNHPPIEKIFQGVKEKVEHLHIPLQQLASSIGSDLREEAEKNLQIIQNQLAYLEHKTVLKLEEKYEQELSQYDEIGNQLKPNQLLQERILSPLPFLNEYGSNFIHEIIEGPPLSFLNSHYFVYID